MNRDRRNYPYPDSVYEALPYMHLFIGLLAMVWLRNTLAVISGLVFIGIGTSIWWMRRQYRCALQDTDSRLDIPTVFREDVLARGLHEISWRDALACGDPVLDAQHRRLFGMSNELIAAIQANEPRPSLEMRLTELLDAVVDHFCHEDMALTNTRHPLCEERRQNHVELMVKAEAMTLRFVAGEAITRELVAFMVYRVIAGHIVQESLSPAS